MKSALWKLTGRHWLLVAPLAVLIISGSAMATDWFVDQNKTSGTSGNGFIDWSDAFMTLEEALGIAESGDTIRVAEGTYTPNDFFGTGDRTQTYLIDENIVILGGYKGEDEGVSLQRDPATFLTILSGDFEGDDAAFSFVREYLTDSSRTDNAFTVVTVQGVTRDNPGTRLEGFIIERGNQGTFTGSNATGYRGGGMLIDDSAMDIVNCTFRFNAVGVPPDPQIQNDPGITSDGGGAAVLGGHIIVDEVQYTRFINCTFHDNFSARGGGLAVIDGSPDDIPTQVKVINCQFYNNRSFDMSEAVLKTGDANDRLVRLPMEVQSP